MSNLEERACKVLEESCLKAFEAGKQSRDAEMERLKTLNETLTETNAELASLVLKTRNHVDELKKRVDACAALAKEWRTLAREMCPLDDKYVIGARLDCAQDIEEVLRGDHVQFP